MKYIFFNDGFETHIADCVNFNDAICEYKNFSQGEKY